MRTCLNWIELDNDKSATSTLNSTKFNLLNWIESTLNWPEMNNNTIVLWSCLKQNWASFIIDELHKIDSYFPVYKSGFCKTLFDFFSFKGKTKP